MLYRRPRRKRFRFHFYGRPPQRAVRVFAVILILTALAFVAVTVALLRVRPAVMKLAVSEVNEAVLTVINDVIHAEIADGALDYGRLISFEKDQSGAITALETNMPLINTLQARISRNVAGAVENRMISDLKIPLGNAVGGLVFSGRGPSFTVKILSIASVHTRFSNSFSAAGINQTRHKVILEVTAVVDVFVPGGRSSPVTVASEVVVAETIIIGQVPNVYADIGTTGGRIT